MFGHGGTTDYIFYDVLNFEKESLKKAARRSGDMKATGSHDSVCSPKSSGCKSCWGDCLNCLEAKRQDQPPRSNVRCIVTAIMRYAENKFAPGPIRDAALELSFLHVLYPLVECDLTA